MEPHARIGLPLARVVGEQLETPVEHARWSKAPGRAQPVAAFDLVALDAVQRERGALTGEGFLDGLAVHLHAAHAHLGTARQELEHVSGAHGAAPQRAGHHGAETLDREHAVDWKPYRVFDA